MRTFLSLLILCLPVTILYGQFLSNPIIFDDVNFFDGSIHEQYLGKVFSFDLRWLPYATFEWTRALLGLELIWFRVGNLTLHLATTISLFFFLRRLFEQTIPSNNQTSESLSLHWLALFGALIFALHPVAVYAAGYLIQRSMLMATLFALLTWRLFLEGLIRKNRRWLLASALTYLLAVFSKEHAIMTPAMTVVLLLLVDNSSGRQRLMLIWPTFVLYALIAGFIVIQIKSGHILGLAYEPMASSFIDLLGPDVNTDFIYPLSILTQCVLFFKYLWIWIVPNPLAMAVDMPQAFARSLWSWKSCVGLIGFIVYPIVAIRLLLQRGVNGLLGFALLCPWLLFATELSTVRIQESFVLYRSYLWMAGAFAALPFLFQKMRAKQAAITLTLIAVFMMPLSWSRLSTFSHPLLLWDDAARQTEHNEEKLLGSDRILYNRGTALIMSKRYGEAIDDLTKAIEQKGYYMGRAYNNRGVAYSKTGQYQLALSDINKAIELVPDSLKFYLNKAKALEGLNDSTAAMLTYKQACSLGLPAACQKTGQTEAPAKSLTEYLLQP